MRQVSLKVALVLLFCLGVAGAVEGQYSPTSDTGEDKFSLSGSVVDAVTGEPVRRALVQLQSAPARTSFTDSDGRFEIDGLPEGRFMISARKPGYYSGTRDADRRSDVPVRVGTNAELVTLKLNPFGVIYGRVTDTEGGPLEHIPVRLTMAIVRNGRRHWQQIGSRDSDENGNFRFPNLQPGTFYLAAGPGSEEPEPLRFAANGGQTAVPQTGYPSVYYPNAPDLSSASPIALTPGQQLQMEFVLNRVPVYKIAGSIAGLSPEQGIGLQLTTASGDMLNVPEQVQSMTGTFEVDAVPPGSYVLKAFSQGRPGESLRASVPVTVATNVNNVRLTLEPVVSIPIVVRQEGRTDDSSPNSSGGRINRYSRMEVPVSVHLSAAGQSLGSSDVYSTLRLSGDQRVPVLENVEPGQYDVEFLPQGGWYVQSADYAGVNLLTDKMIVGSRPSGGIQIVLRDDGATLAGTAKLANDDDSGYVSVLIIPQRAPRESKVIPVFGEGTFHVDGLPPGDYSVLAARNLDGLEYSNAEALRPYLSQATHVTLSASQTTKVDLTPISIGDSGQ